MEARFILPATVAAAFHTFVLFGVTWPHRPPPPIDPPTKGVVCDFRQTDPAEEPPPVDDSTTSMEKAQKGERLDNPHIDEPPVSDGPGIKIQVEPVRHGPMDPHAEIIGKIGDPFGDESGGRPDKIISSIKLDNHPRTRASVAPLYPNELKSRGVEGTVVVEFIVDENGHVTNPRVVRSTDSRFEDATLRAVVNWRFEPGRKDNRVVRFRMALPVDFKIEQ